MKVNDQLYVLELPLNFGGVERKMSLSLIVDSVGGLTLVDTGLPGQIELFEQAIVAEGLSMDDLKQIVLTHQDLDHIGSLDDLRDETGATVYSHVEEVPYINGTVPLVKTPSEERLAENPEYATVWGLLKFSQVDEAVKDGDVLSFAAGAVVISTPGHTPGHISLYLPNTKTLITGDALVSDQGILSGPAEFATPDMPLALESVKKFTEFDIETIVCYHGGLVTDDANGQIRRVAGI